MNSPLLALDSNVQTAASAAAGVADADPAPSDAFAELLSQASESPSMMAGAKLDSAAASDADGDIGAFLDDLSSPTDGTFAGLVANFQPAPVSTEPELATADVTASTDAESNTEDPADARPAGLLPILGSPMGMAIETPLQAEVRLDLPGSGKALPMAWLPTSQQLAKKALTDVDAGSFDTAKADESASDLSDGWQQLFERASNGVELPALKAVNSTQANPEPLLAINSLAGGMFAESLSARTTAAETVAGIPARSANFVNLVGNEVLWQAKLGNSQVEIRLDPPELGPIDVRISQSEKETHLHFTVAHQATRDQLEQALPRLRELFGQGGLQLGQVEVEQGRREQLAQSSRDGDQGKGKASTDTQQPEELPVSVSLSIGLIDAYA